MCSLVSSVALAKKAPFLSLKTHGLVVTDDNQKMSKSEGQVIDPEDLIQGTVKLDG